MISKIAWIGLFIFCISCSWSVVRADSADRLLRLEKLGDGWVEAEGQARLVNITPEEARRRALQDARERAIMFAVGIEVQAHTLMREEESDEWTGDAFYSLSQQTSAGRIVEEKPAEWESFEIPGKPLAIIVYRARIQVKVAEEKGVPDPDFEVEVAVNKERFLEGEEMRLAITATRKCYLNVLNLTAVDTVVVLLPHQYRQERLVVPGDTLWIPDADEKAMGIRYRVVLPAGREKATEMIKVVATREPHRFGQGMEKSSIFNQVPTRQAALMELMRWMVQIPRDKRAEAQVVYEVRKKGKR